MRRPKAVYMGIDPGQSSGCLAIGFRYDELLEDVETHRIKNMTRLEIVRLFKKISYYRHVLRIPVYSYVERVRCNGLNGSKANWSMGGSIESLAYNHLWAGVIMEEVAPKMWQKHFKITRSDGMNDTAWRKHKRQHAENHFPEKNKMVAEEVDGLLLLKYSFNNHQKPVE